MKLIKVNCPVGFKIPVRARPDIHSEALKFLRTGDEFYIVSESIGFYILSENQGYVNKATRGVDWVEKSEKDPRSPSSSVEAILKPDQSERRPSRVESQETDKNKLGTLIKQYSDQNSGPGPSSDGVVTTSTIDPLSETLSKIDGVMLLHYLWDECESMPYKVKKELKNQDMGFDRTPNTPDIINYLVHKMGDIISCSFLQVDWNLTRKPRSVDERCWSSVSAIQRSSEGTVGIFMIQSKYRDHTSDIVVAKPFTQVEYENQVFVSRMADHFKINCPKIRAMERQSDEWKELKASVDKFYIVPFHEGLYVNGGRASPKPLFDSSLIMLMEFAEGKPLQHKVKDQRQLVADDFSAIGKLFLYDLLIRNTDRLPCRRTIPRTVAGGTIADQGNAGNIMLGERGELCAIDNEIQLSISADKKEEYLKSLKAVVTEIINRQDKWLYNRHISSLYFEPFQPMRGVLDKSLEELTPWRSNDECQTMAVSALLQLIRVRVKADEGLLHSEGVMSPPDRDDEAEWREWIRLTVPRAIADVMAFIEATTGYPCYNDESAWDAFEYGFKSCMDEVVQSKDEFKKVLEAQNILTANRPNEVVQFVLQMIDEILAPVRESPRKAQEMWKVALRKALSSNRKDKVQN